MKNNLKSIFYFRNIHFSVSSFLIIVSLLSSQILTQVTLSPSAFAFPASLGRGVPPAQAPDIGFAAGAGLNTFINLASQTFATFLSTDNLEIPVKMGRVEWDGVRERFIVTLQIETLGGIYVLRNPQNPYFLEVTERLPEGGFGRLLRYRSRSIQEKPVDLEFVYQDREKRLTILDYQANRFFQTTFASERKETPGFFPSGEKEANFAELIATPCSLSKFIGGNVPVTARNPFPAFHVHSRSNFLSEEEIWSSRRVRGPPFGEALP